MIGQAFFALYRDFKAMGHTHYWCKGGRGSLKSSFWAIMAVLTIKRDPKANVIYLRKVGNTLRDSCFSDVLWAIDALGVTHEFRAGEHFKEFTYIKTGQKIYMRGVDKPENRKSFRPRVGYFKLIIFEEADQFNGHAEIRKLLQTFMRGGQSQVAYLFNPPKSRDQWINKHILSLRNRAMVHFSTYHDVPRDWLGEQFFDEADDLRETNLEAYLNEYEGEVTGTGGAVFDNLEIREITSEERSGFDRIYNGVDWGWFPDIWAFARCHYDRARRTLYIFDEASGIKLTNEQSARIVKQKLTRQILVNGKVTSEYVRERVECDSAEPKSVDDYRSHGINARGAIKGPGSVEAGIKWLVSLKKIVIDPSDAPVSSTEFSGYEHMQTRVGEYVTGYPDKDNHMIDAVRYALEPVWTKRSKR